MPCNCGGQKHYNMTSAQLEAQRVRDDLNALIAAESAKASTGEHDPKPVSS